MSVKFTNENHRIFAQDENGELLAEIVFPHRSVHTVDITRTFVSPVLRGQGVADQLMRAVVELLEAKHLKAHTSCPYAAKWFEKNPSYAHLLAE